MSNKPALYRLALLSLPLLVIGGILLRLALRQEGCFGMPDGLIKLFLWCVGGLYFGAVLFICLKKYAKDENAFELSPLFIPVGIWLVYQMITILSNTAQNKPVLMAYLTPQENYSDKTLVLHEDQRYRVEIRYVEASCIYSGQYQLTNDTLHLEKKVIDQTGQALHQTYLLKNTYLIPLIDGKASMDTSLYLKIDPIKH
jgi:hypothetical protein